MKVRPACAAVVSIGTSLLLLAGIRSTQAGEIKIVSPSAYEDMEGEGATGDNCCDPFHAQQVLPAEDFAVLGNKPHWIVGLTTRPDQSVTGPRTVHSPDIEFRLSTTQRGPDNLSLQFDDNLGSDVMQFYRGPLNLVTDVAGPGPGPREFYHAERPAGVTPYLYDPSQGNLLFDVIARQGISPSHRNDRTTSSVQTAIVGSPSATHGGPNTAAIFQFTFVPELETPVGTWNVDAGGNWSLPANWAGGVPNGTGARAVFGSVITSPRTVTIDAPTTVGRLDFENTNTYTIAGQNVLTLDATSGDAQINVAGGSHTITAPVTLADNATITVTPAASNLSLTGSLNANGRNLTKVGDGTLTVNNLRAADVSVNGGTVAIAPSGTSATTSVMRSLTVAGATDTWTAKLDLANNDAVVQSSAANKAADFARLYNQLKQGFNNGDWRGFGITSASAAANATADTGLSAVDNALLGYSDFSGQPVTADSILLKYTYYGDIDQNGAVDADDLTVFANNFGRASGATQVEGDIDFNGAVNADDLTVFANNFGKGIGNSLAAASVQAVPEPATVALAAMGLAAIIAATRMKLRKLQFIPSTVARSDPRS